ncbi:MULTISPECIES: phosphocholine cytidylyltransferase family protein [unclassified Bradyrhizobium]|uniref:phosphocholine cytidylyltransferase family protein n=1 Tax=unclassified Bradyrhizobium TaxID=2631580 RepID=UPI0029161363|nr:MULTISPECIES: phosphocholine cytidylyltransferase family protein [unclassified Bradyrhizobium]
MPEDKGPARAVILAAGLGSRLRPLTNDLPKPLVRVNGVPILQNTLAALSRSGIRQATLVVGYRKELIIDAFGDRFGQLELSYVDSMDYASTGSAHSLWLARAALLQGDVVLIEGDVFFEPAVLRRLLAEPSGDVAAVAPFDEEMAGSAVTLSPSGMIDEILLRQTAADSAPSRPLCKLLNIYRLSEASMKDQIVPALQRSAASGSSAAYVEEIISLLVRREGLQIAACNCGDLKWYEIDDASDLRRAEAIFSNQREAAELRN